MGISARSTISLAKDLRLASKNRKVVQPGIQRLLKQHIHKLNSTFTVQKLVGSDIPVVFCNYIDAYPIFLTSGTLLREFFPKKKKNPPPP